MNITLTLDDGDARYLLERLGPIPPFIDSLSSDQERRDAVSYDCIVGQLERGLGYAERAVAFLVSVHPTLAEEERPICQWFALCDHPAAGVVFHRPSAENIPTCKRCADNLDLELVEYR